MAETLALRRTGDETLPELMLIAFDEFVFYPNFIETIQLKTVKG